MSGTYNRRDFEDWDSVFEDSEPTRVITPESAQQARELEGDTAPFESQPNQQATMPAARRNQPSQLTYTEETRPGTTQIPYSQPESESLHTVITASPQAVNTFAYRRVQFIPSSSGALVAYALGTGLFTVARSIFEALGVSTYSNFTGAVMAVSTVSSQSQAVPWVITSTLIWLFSFGCAGYTASRMAIVAPAKQAIGVLAVTCFAVLVATLITWMTVSLPSPIAPSFALQPLLDPDLGIGSLTALAIGLFVAIGSLLGAWFGIRYYNRLTSKNT